jgi:RNA polymerase sigma-70 factor (ECF subfamily)
LGFFGVKPEGSEEVASLTVVQRAQKLQPIALEPASTAEATDELYRAHAEFVWRTLQRMGVGHADLEDLTHEVFVVVHKRVAEFRGEARVTTWLFAICLRVVKRHRRRAWFWRERPLPADHDPITEQTPEVSYDERERLRRLERVLSTLSPEHRAVFVLFELEHEPCDRIASMMGVPVGTVYSRLHAARKRFARGFSRQATAEWINE